MTVKNAQNTFIRIVETATACVDREGKDGSLREFDLIDDLLIIVDDPSNDISIQIFVTAGDQKVKVFDATACENGELLLYKHDAQHDTWFTKIENFAREYPVRTRATFEEVSGLHTVIDY